MDVLTQPVFYKFRYTFSRVPSETWTDQDLEFFDEVLRYTVEILKVYLDSDGQLTSGLEFLNSSGALAKPHIHIHFKSHAKRDTIARTLQRAYLQAWKIELKGPQVYFLKPEVYVRGERIFRYPLKQGLGKYQSGFTEDQLKLMHQVAHEEWKMSCEINSNKRDKAELATTLFDRLHRYVCDQPHHDRDAICAAVVQFYVNENKPINRTTVVGYTDRLMLEFGLLTAEQMARNLLR